jgi:outer membrane protein assembly factor BamD (BamD/ComL family)
MSLRNVFFRSAVAIVCLAAANGWQCSHGATSYTFDKQLLSDADGKFKQRKYAEAIAQYNEIVKTFPKTASARIALYKIGFVNIYFENDQPDWTASLNAFKLFQKNYRDDPKIDEINTWMRILVAMDMFSAQYNVTSARVQTLKKKTLEKTGDVEQLREEFLRCSFEKDSLNLEKNALLQKIKKLEETIELLEQAK